MVRLVSPGFTGISVEYTLLNQGGNPGQGGTSPALFLDNLFPGTIDFYYYGSAGGVQLVSQATAQWNTNTWYYVAVTSDGSGNRCLYVNGVCEASATDQPFGQSQPNFYIGAAAANNGLYFPGDIDDVNIYNRALSAQEIQELYAGASIAQPTVQFSPLLAGRTYTPQFSTDLVSGVWLPLTTVIGPVTNGNQVSITDIKATQPAKFYRIDISKP